MQRSLSFSLSSSPYLSFSLFVSVFGIKKRRIAAIFPLFLFCLHVLCDSRGVQSQQSALKGQLEALSNDKLLSEQRLQEKQQLIAELEFKLREQQDQLHAEVPC